MNRQPTHMQTDNRADEVHTQVEGGVIEQHADNLHTCRLTAELMKSTHKSKVHGVIE